MFKVKEAKIISPTIREVEIIADTRVEAKGIDAKTMAVEQAQISGLQDPAYEPARGGTRRNKKTGKYHKVYRFIGS